MCTLNDLRARRAGATFRRRRVCELEQTFDSPTSAYAWQRSRVGHLSDVLLLQPYFARDIVAYKGEERAADRRRNGRAVAPGIVVDEVRPEHADEQNGERDGDTRQRCPQVPEHRAIPI
jgi:hypothetical protein